jgi:hypothetical protein
MLKPLPHAGSSEPFDDSRTEDTKFSPSGRILAQVATSGSVFLFAVDTDSSPVRTTRCAELRSSGLASPHGVDFVRENVIVVANRSGCVTFLRLPDVWKDRVRVDPIHEMHSDWFGRTGSTRSVEGRAVACGPGSIRASGDHLFVCCNYRNTVTAHPYRIRRDAIETGEGVLVAQTGLQIPDGVALTRGGRWMAVSDHHNRRVAIYRRTDGARTCELRDPDLHYPHGLCFDPSGQSLYVADAGGRDLHVFVGASGWDSSVARSAFKLPAVDAEAFRKTRAATPEAYRKLEGGIKGIDLDPSGRIIATTCRHQILRFFETEHANTGATAAEPGCPTSCGGPAERRPDDGATRPLPA